MLCSLLKYPVPVFLTEKKVAIGGLSKSMQKELNIKPSMLDNTPPPGEILTVRYHSVRKNIKKGVYYRKGKCEK
jgi:hypothetical protein